MDSLSREIIDPLIAAVREGQLQASTPQAEEFLSAFVARHPHYATQLDMTSAVAILARVGEIAEQRELAEARALQALKSMDEKVELIDREFYGLVGRIAEERGVYSRSDMLRREELLTSRDETLKARANAVQFDADFFFAEHGSTLNRYVTQLQTGKLVITPYVQEKLDQVLQCLQRHFYVLLHGDTGSGKTELAKLAASTFSRGVHGNDCNDWRAEPILLRCYRGMGTEEIFGSFTLKSSENGDFAEVPQRIENAIQQWKKKNPDCAEGKAAEATRAITESIVRQSGCTVSEYMFGAVYRAAKYGGVVIFDEINFAPPEMLVKFNEFLNLRPGEAVHVQEDAVPAFPMHRGFGFLCTGNIDYGDSKRYGSGRFEFEPSRLNRLTMIDYDYLPQAVRGDANEIETPQNKQLYSIALASLLSPRGIASLPEGSLEAIWRLCKYARLTQIAFSGQLGRDDDNAFLSGGAAIEHRPEVLISPRNLVRILYDWRHDGFRYELDHYLYQHFICSTLKAADGVLLYQLGQKQEFFRSPGWPEGLADLEKAGAFPFRVEDPHNRSRSLRYYHRDEIIESIFGAAPLRMENIEGSSGPSSRQRLELSEVLLEFEDLRAEVKKIKDEFQHDFGTEA